MATAVSICSNALRKLGDDPITSLTDDTERARLCNAFYEPTRDAVLRSHPWNFAIERQENYYQTKVLQRFFILHKLPILQSLTQCSQSY